MSKKGLNTKGIAKLTGTSSSKAAKAGHQARNDMGARKSGGPKFNSSPGWAPKSAGGVSTTPKRSRK